MSDRSVVMGSASDLERDIAEEESYHYRSRPWMGPPWESAAAERVRRATRTLVRAIETWAIFAGVGVPAADAVKSFRRFDQSVVNIDCKCCCNSGDELKGARADD